MKTTIHNANLEIDSQQAESIVNIEKQTIYENIERNVIKLKQQPLYFLSTFFFPGFITVFAVIFDAPHIMVCSISFVIYVVYFFLKSHISEHPNMILRNLKSLVVYCVFLFFTYSASHYQTLYQKYLEDMGNPSPQVVYYKTNENVEALQTRINAMTIQINALQDALQRLDATLQETHSSVSTNLNLITNQVKDNETRILQATEHIEKKLGK